MSQSSSNAFRYAITSRVSKRSFAPCGGASRTQTASWSFPSASKGFGGRMVIHGRRGAMGMLARDILSLGIVPTIPGIINTDGAALAS